MKGNYSLRTPSMLAGMDSSLGGLDMALPALTPEMAMSASPRVHFILTCAEIATRIL